MTTKFHLICQPDPAAGLRRSSDRSDLKIDTASIAFPVSITGRLKPITPGEFRRRFRRFASARLRRSVRHVFGQSYCRRYRRQFFTGCEQQWFLYIALKRYCESSVGGKQGTARLNRLLRNRLLKSALGTWTDCPIRADIKTENVLTSRQIVVLDSFNNEIGLESYSTCRP
jgi:hypothetical protein